MKFIVFVLFIISLFIAPIFVFADCSKIGATVIFVNGIFETKNSAKLDKDSLQQDFKYYTKRDDVTFVNGYNESHVGGADDLVNSVIQAYTGGYLDHDLTDVLRQAHVDLKTQKILLVGHSQGTFYTNAAYDYLVSHGVDKSAITVYNVATPADRVAGNGKYLNSSTDGVINSIFKNLTEIGFARKPLPANIDIKIPNEKGVDYEDGHSFSTVYLGLAPDRIVGDMDQELSGLVANSDKGDCFSQPKIDTMYRVFDEGYTLADDVGKYSNYAATSPFLPSQMASLANSLVQGTYKFGKNVVAGVVHIFTQNKLFGASLASAPIQNVVSGPAVSSNSPSQPQSPEVAAAVEPNPADYSSANEPDVAVTIKESVQDQLDDIQEKLDLISQQVQALIIQQNPEIQLAVVEKDKTPDDKVDQKQDSKQDSDTNTTKKYNIGGGSRAVYPKILISEVQTAGVADDKQEFVELYNPNSQEVDLTGWYLQRKTAGSSDWSTYASNSLFSGKEIMANSYFIIARTGYTPSFVDVITENPLTDDNSLALKDPNGDISDKLGFGAAEDPELVATANPAAGKSVGRKVLSSGSEQDFDNNITDFEAQTPTPRAQNITYIEPIQPVPQVLKNILISEVKIAEKTGDKDVFIELYNPNNTAVDLTGWYIFRNGSSFVTKVMLTGKEIAANSYFLLTKEGSIWDGQSDLLFSGTLNQDDAIILKNVNGDSIDGVSWAQITTGLSLGRGWDDSLSSYVDSDNDAIDLKLDTPTPNAKNVEYSVPTPSSDDTVTSGTYAVSSLVSGAGNITGVTYQTSKTALESSIIVATGATADFSAINNPVKSGDTLTVTAQDGITKATYTVTVDTINLAQGIVDSFTPAGGFTLHTSDFLPNLKANCGFYVKVFENVYPERTNEVSAGSGPCSDFFPAYVADASGLKTPGEYDFYLAYCGGTNCYADYPGASFPVSDYYRTYFDGTNWSFLPPDMTKTRLSDDATLTATNSYMVDFLSPIYTAGILLSGNGTITNVRLGTTRADFEAGLKVVTGATLDFSSLTDPIATGNTLTAISQSGTTRITYTVTVDTITWSQGTIISSTPTGQFSLNTSFLTDDPQKTCNSYFYKALYPFKTNDPVYGSFPCGGGSGIRPVYNLDMSLLPGAGDYTLWMFDNLTSLGEYYEFHSDGTSWSSVGGDLVIDTTPPSITGYTITNPIISPNSDGTKDTTSIDLLFSEDVKVDVDIVDSNNIKVKDLYTSSKVKNPDVKIWDGKNSSGVVVPDGVYTIKITITDLGKNSITDTSKTITVDNTAPVITLTGDTMINLAIGTDYAELGASTDDGSVVNITGSVDKNTAGPYNISYGATDAAGNQAATVVRTVVVGS